MENWLIGYWLLAYLLFGYLPNGLLFISFGK